MQTIATLSPADAQSLGAFLAKQNIAYETRESTDENGLDATELEVTKEVYEAACAATEAWDARRIAEYERRTPWRCPSCNSPHIERVEDIEYEKTATMIKAIFRCRDCKHLFAPRH